MFGSEKRKFRNDVVNHMIFLAPIGGTENAEAFKAVFRREIDQWYKAGRSPLSAVMGLGMHFTKIIHNQTKLSNFASINLLNPYKMWLINLADVIANDPQFNGALDDDARKELRKQINWLSKCYVSAEEEAKDKPIIYADYLKTGRMFRDSMKKNLDL